MGEQTTSAAPKQGKFVSIRTLLVVRFIIMMILLTIGLALIFYFFVAPGVVAEVQGHVEDALRAANVSETQIQTILDGNQERYFSTIRTSIRQKVMMATTLYFGVGLVSILIITTQATRWLSDLTRAARGIAKGDYKQDLSHISKVMPRSEINELAEAIEESGRVHIREMVLIEKVKELEIRIDETKKQEQVDELTGSEFFQELQGKAKAIRKSRTPNADESP